MRSPLVMPRAGQKSLRRLVSFTRRSPSATSTSSWPRGIIPPAGQRAGVGGGRRGPRRVAGWWSVVARGIALGNSKHSDPGPGERRGRRASGGRMPTREEATRLFEQRRDAWLREDLDAYLALWAEDMTFQSPVHAEPLRGRTAFANLVRQAFAFARPLAFDF